MTSDSRAKSRRNVAASLSAALSVYLYAVGFFLGTRGSPDMAESIANAAPSIGDLAFMFAVAPFLVLPGLLGLTYVGHGPYPIIGTVFAVALFCATYAVLRRRELRTWWLLLSPLYAYALGYAVEFVLTAHFGVREAPLSF